MTFFEQNDPVLAERSPGGAALGVPSRVLPKSGLPSLQKVGDEERCEISYRVRRVHVRGWPGEFIARFVRGLEYVVARWKSPYPPTTISSNWIFFLLCTRKSGGVHTKKK